MDDLERVPEMELELPLLLRFCYSRLCHFKLIDYNIETDVIAIYAYRASVSLKYICAI